MAENSPGNFPQRTKTIGSMYDTFIYIWHTFMVNVGKSSIHGSYEKKDHLFICSRVLFHQHLRGDMFLYSTSKFQEEAIKTNFMANQPTPPNVPPLQK